MSKERYEWVQSWCDEADESGPRVLLIGDSIARGYEGLVREGLRGRCRLDYLSMSYAAEMPIFGELIRAFIKDSRYDVIHFNHGLHGWDMSVQTYKECLKELFLSLEWSGKLILATTTFVYEYGNERPKSEKNKVIAERNTAVRELAEEHGYMINDLYCVSKSERSMDGTHYEHAGSEELADSVVKCVLKAFEN